jgi:hypothetical protein
MHGNGLLARTRNALAGMVAALAVLALAPAAAHAGALTLYSSIQGAGSVVNSAGDAYSCVATDQTRNTDVRDCGTKTYNATLSVSITLKATAKAGWRRVGWDGCPEVLTTGECKITSPSFSRGYETVKAIFADSVGPKLTIDSYKVNADDSVTGWFHADEPATFECLAPGLVWVACASGWTHPPYPPQDYSYDVRATDVNGQSTTERVTFRIFDTQIYAAPSGLVTSRSATVTFGGTNNPAGYQCSRDGGAWFACTSPYSYDTGSDGPHTFQVRGLRGTDADPYPATRNWVVDTAAPETAITGGPAGPGEVRDTTATFSFGSPSDPGGAAFECRLDGAPWSPCRSPVTYPGLAQGAHAFEVRAKDAAGNIDPSPASRSWSIDTIPSETTLEGGPDAGAVVASTSASFGFSAPDGATFECSLDDGGWTTCASPLELAGLGEGEHTFRVRSTDDAGNVEPDPPARTWTVDTVAPVTRFTAGPAEGATLAAGAATFAFAAGEPGATFECRLDGGAWAACTSPRALSGLAPGAHSFEVRATDGAGNAEPTPARRSFSVSVPGKGDGDGVGGAGGAGGGGGGGGSAAKPRIGGPRKLTVRADRRGRFTLARVRVTCPAGGACRVTGSAKGRAAQAASTVRAGATAGVRATLSRAARATLRAKGRVVVRLALRATGPGGAASRTVKVTVRAR